MRELFNYHSSRYVAFVVHCSLADSGVYEQIGWSQSIM